MAEKNMKRKVIYKVESGSYLYGTNTETSDTDYSSVFLPTNYDLLSLQKCGFINDGTKNSSDSRRNTAEDIDNQQYSISRYIHLVLHGNPNLTEILFCKNPIIEDPVFTIFKENYSKLLSNTVYDSFTGFAVSQKKKLEYKSMRFTQLAKSLAFLEDTFKEQIQDPTANMTFFMADWLNKNLTEYKGRKNNRESFHEGLPVKVIYEKIKAEYDNYGWRVHTDTFETLGYDVKFASHVIRLLHEGRKLLLNGRLEFPITGKAHEDIMNVRRSEASINEFYRLCTEYEDANRKAREKSVLPDKADWKWANRTLVSILEDSVIRECQNTKE